LFGIFLVFDYNVISMTPMKKTTIIMIVLILSSFSLPVFADQQSSSVSSPKCNEKKLKTLTGDALIKIVKGSWEGGYTITLETSKMTFVQLTKKMMDAGCF